MSNESTIKLERLKRVLYSGTYQTFYICGDPERHSLKDFKLREFIEGFLESNESIQEFLSVLINVSDDVLMPHRLILHFILAQAIDIVGNDNKMEKNLLSSAVLKVCKTDEEFFNFIKHFTLLREKKNKLPTTILKCISKFYDGKNPIEMAESVSKASSYHGWKHKDLMKLAHYNDRSLLKLLLIQYTLYGLDKIKDNKIEDSDKILEIIEKWQELRKTSDEMKAAALITELHANSIHVNPALLKSEEVWLALIPELSIHDLLASLLKLYKLGFLKPNKFTLAKVTDALTDTEKVKTSRIHPVQVFLYLKHFEKGGRPIDAKYLEHLKKKIESAGDSTEPKPALPANVEPKCNHVVHAIHKTLTLAYRNVKSTGKNILITLEVSERMDNPCFNNKHISCLDACVAVILFLLKTEKNVTLSIYKNKEIQILNFEKNISFPQAVKKIRETKSTFIYGPAPFNWAAQHKKNVDVFINFIHGGSYSDIFSAVPEELKNGNRKINECLKNYNNKKKTNARWLVMCFPLHNLAMTDVSADNQLQICGFSEELPLLMDAFINEKFK